MPQLAASRKYPHHCHPLPGLDHTSIVQDCWMERLRCDDDFGLGRAIQWYRTLAHFWTSFGSEIPKSCMKSLQCRYFWRLNSRWKYFGAFLKCVWDTMNYMTWLAGEVYSVYRVFVRLTASTKNAVFFCQCLVHDRFATCWAFLGEGNATN